MKILFENWRKYLVEDVDPHAKTKVARPKEVPETDEYASPYEYEETEEGSREKYFGLNPDNIQCIRDIRDPDTDVYPTDFYECMKQEGYTKLGAGSFRAVLEIPENPELVLKIVGPAAASDLWKQKSMEMNREEAQASYQTASDLVPKVYDSAKDYFWIVSEKVKPITSWSHMKNYFPQWRHEDTDDFAALFHDLIAQERDENSLIDSINRRKFVRGGKELVNDSLILKIRDLLAQFKVPTWDIRPHNVGYTIRNGSSQFVILDPGFVLDRLDDPSPEKEQEPESSPLKDKSEPNKPEIETAVGKLAKLSENLRLFVENTEIKGPYDFLYDITTSPDKISINLLDIMTKEPVESKKEGTSAHISLEKRTDVPHWEVSWSSSPKNSKKVGTTMYLMALELAEEGLSPDSYETSPDAERIWAKFMKKNDYGVKKEVKDEHEDKDETNPFNFVFFKPNTTTLDKYEDNITRKEVESEEKGGFDPEKEEEFEYFDPETADWDEIDELEEQTEPYQRFSRGTYAKFIGKLANQGKNKYNVGGRMKKASNKHLKSGPPGG